MIRNFPEEGLASKILLIIVEKENVEILDQLKWSKFGTFSKFIFHSHNT